MATVWPSIGKTILDLIHRQKKQLSSSSKDRRDLLSKWLEMSEKSEGLRNQYDSKRFCCSNQPSYV
jgi:hypothetical protein